MRKAKVVFSGDDAQEVHFNVEQSEEGLTSISMEFIPEIKEDVKQTLPLYFATEFLEYLSSKSGNEVDFED